MNFWRCWSVQQRQKFIDTYGAAGQTSSARSSSTLTALLVCPAILFRLAFGAKVKGRSGDVQATLLDDLWEEYSKWKASRVYVNKDAQKIIILEPSKEYTREDGTKGISYNAKVVYDISETSAKDRQQEQEPKSMRELVSALIDASPVPCVPVDELELPAYYDSSQQTIFVKKGLSEEVLFVSMAKEVSAAVYDFKYNESRDVSDFNSFCVAYMVSSRYGVDTRGFDFSRLPREYAEMDTQAFKGELGTMRDVLGEIQSDMYKSMEKNKPAKNKEQER